MPEQRHPDIEIYIKNTSLSATLEWLNAHSSNLTVERETASYAALQVTFEQTKVQVDIYQKVSGKAWSSVWIKTNNTPWSTDLECAKSAAQHLNSQVRCMANSWQEHDDDQEMWWRVEDGEQTQIEWKV